jgi:hypothetical protein
MCYHTSSALIIGDSIIWILEIDIRGSGSCGLIGFQFLKLCTWSNGK